LLLIYQLEDSLEFCNSDLVLDTARLYSGNYQAGEKLQSKSKISSNADVTFTASQNISLLSNFSIDAGATFKVRTNDCVEEVGCCPADPLSEPFLQNYVNDFAGFKIFQARDENGNCIFRIESDYSSSCDAIIADLPKHLRNGLPAFRSKLQNCITTAIGASFPASSHFTNIPNIKPTYFNTNHLPPLQTNHLTAPRFVFHLKNICF